MTDQLKRSHASGGGVVNRPVEVSRADLGHLIELAMLATDRTPTNKQPSTAPSPPGRTTTSGPTGRARDDHRHRRHP
ncbi:MAG: hypothetical protein IPG97_15845 [Microthrixaceae bacterium]|nr:hypothetical protein [Microthrixaceae bacterium]